MMCGSNIVYANFKSYDDDVNFWLSDANAYVYTYSNKFTYPSYLYILR